MVPKCTRSLLPGLVVLHIGILGKMGEEEEESRWKKRQAPTDRRRGKQEVDRRKQ